MSDEVDWRRAFLARRRLTVDGISRWRRVVRTEVFLPEDFDGIFLSWKNRFYMVTPETVHEISLDGTVKLSQPVFKNLYKYDVLCRNRTGNMIKALDCNRGTVFSYTMKGWTPPCPLVYSWNTPGKKFWYDERSNSVLNDFGAPSYQYTGTKHELVFIPPGRWISLRNRAWFSLGNTFFVSSLRRVSWTCYDLSVPNSPGFLVRGPDGEELRGVLSWEGRLYLLVGDRRLVIFTVD